LRPGPGRRAAPVAHPVLKPREAIGAWIYDVVREGTPRPVIFGPGRDWEWPPERSPDSGSPPASGIPPMRLEVRGTTVPRYVAEPGGGNQGIPDVDSEAFCAPF
jgi:hypothetical protein